MSSPKLITVFGATGTQGGSIVNSLLTSKEGKEGAYKIRAVTRDPTSSSSNALKEKYGEKNIEFVKADWGNVESLREAVRGSEIVFAVTGIVDGMMKGDLYYEVTQGKNLADATKAEQCKAMIWSSVPSFAKHTNGKYNMPIIENKTTIVNYMKEIDLPYIALNCPFFAENMWKGSLLQKLRSGDFEIRVASTDPDALEPFLWVNRDFGDAVLAVVRHYPEVIGKTFDCITELVSFTQLAEILSKATGRKITFKPIETFEAGPVFSPILNEMYAAFSEFGKDYMPNVPDPSLIALGHQPTTLEEFGKTDFLAYLKGL